jgi:polysaccharide biosynthesis/export protein
MTASFPLKSIGKEHVVKNFRTLSVVLAFAVLAAVVPARAQQPSAAAAPSQAMATPPAVPPTAGAAAGVTLPPGYVIGPEDVLLILYWKDKDMSAEVSVRPDGRITLPLLNDVQAAGLTPDELREQLMKASAKFVEEPNVTVVVKTINSQKVFITGMVAKSGNYPLTAPTTVMQLIAMAGGIQEFADSKNILVVRNENGRPISYRFNYKEVLKRKNLKQNIELKPGDTVIVP